MRCEEAQVLFESRTLFPLFPLFLPSQLRGRRRCRRRGRRRGHRRGRRGGIKRVLRGRRCANGRQRLAGLLRRCRFGGGHLRREALAQDDEELNRGLGSVGQQRTAPAEQRRTTLGERHLANESEHLVELLRLLHQQTKEHGGRTTRLGELGGQRGIAARPERLDGGGRVARRLSRLALRPLHKVLERGKVLELREASEQQGRVLGGTHGR